MNKTNQSNRCSCQYEHKKCTPEIENLLSDMHIVINEAREAGVLFESKEEFLQFIDERNYGYVVMSADSIVLAFMLWKTAEENPQRKDIIYDVCANALDYMDGYDYAAFNSSSQLCQLLIRYRMKCEYLEWYRNNAAPVDDYTNGLIALTVEGLFIILFYNMPGYEILQIIGLKEPEF